MFRLLTILIALHFASKGDGAPGTGKLESSGNIAAGHKTNHLDLILDDEDAEKKTVLASAKETILTPRTNGDIRAPATEPTLKKRKLGETITKKTPLFGGKSTTRVKSASTTAPSTQIKRSGSNGTLTQNSFDDEPATTQGKKGPSPVWVKESSSLQKKKDLAKSLVTKVRALLSQPGADPHKNEELAQLMGTAIRQYNQVYERDWSPIIDETDDESLVNEMRKELNIIFDDLDRRNGSIPPLESSSGPIKIIKAQAPPPSLAKETSVLQKKQDFAKKQVNSVRALLSKPGANPHTDEDLVKFIGTTIYNYNKAFDRDGLKPWEIAIEDDESQVNSLVKEMNAIFDDLDFRNGITGQRDTPLVAAKGKVGSSSKGFLPSLKKEPEAN